MLSWFGDGSLPLTCSTGEQKIIQLKITEETHASKDWTPISSISCHYLNQETIRQKCWFYLALIVCLAQLLTVNTMWDIIRGESCALLTEVLRNTKKLNESVIPAPALMNLHRKNKVGPSFKPRSCRDQVSHRKYNFQTKRKSITTMFTINPTSLWQSLWQTKL